MQIKIKIPDNATLIVKPNSQVDFGMPLYDADDEKDLVNINYTDVLRINPRDIFQYTDKFVGQGIDEGEVIAHKKSLFGSKKLVSQHQGTIERIDHLEGLIYIKTKQSIQSQINSFFKGKIVDYDKKTRILTIEIEGQDNSFDITQSNNDGGGGYDIILDENRFFTIREDAINNKIIVTDNITINLSTKLSALGAYGIIYTQGSTLKNILSWQLKDKSDIEKISKSKTKYVIISSFEKKLYLY